MTTSHPQRSESRLDGVLAWLAEMAFVVDTLVVGLVVFVIVAAGKNPFSGALTLTVLAVTAVIVALHHRWMVRYRDDLAREPALHHVRERRGF